ncbi:MAG: PLP-dependent transferase [Planctomycetes bacterium]|nr:PLP-dependent transferase [Planctomycetota bacterium]
MKKKITCRPHPPIHREAGFGLIDADTTHKAFEEEAGHPRAPRQYIYSRYRNPTVAAAEERLMALEGCAWALLTQSGMAAIDLILTTLQKGKETRPWLFFRDIYGGTNSYIDTVLIKHRGIDVERYDAEEDRFDMDRLKKRLDEVEPELLFFEGVSNPMLIVADGRAVIETAKARDLLVVVDNTFGTPALWKPLEDGADVVIHSATKYLAGHNNLTAGVVCGNDLDLEKQALECRKWIGHMLSPDDAARLDIQVKTFELRFERQCDNARRLAKLLADHDKVQSVAYPGLESHKTHEEAKKLFRGRGFGAMITFDLHGGNAEEKRRATNRFIKALSDEIRLVPTLGDVETTLLPVEPVWGARYPHPGMIRLSLGIEPFEALEKMVLEALASL